MSRSSQSPTPFSHLHLVQTSWQEPSGRAKGQYRLSCLCLAIINAAEVIALGENDNQPWASRAGLKVDFLSEVIIFSL